MSPRNIAKKIAEFASDKKADDIVVLDMRKLVNFCDYFVLCSGNTDRQVKAIADGIDEGLLDLGVEHNFKKALKTTDWIVLDSGDIITHIFRKDLRDFYHIESLWQDAKPIKWEK